MRVLTKRWTRAILVLGAVAAAITVAGTALSTTNEAAKQRAIRATKTKVRTAREVASPTAQEIKDVGEVALRIAAANGDPTPRAISLVPTTRGAANDIDTGATVDTDEAVLMVSMQGDFVGNFASGPSHGFTPRGSVLSFTYDAATGQTLDLSLGPLKPNLAQLGQVIELPR